MVDPAQNGGRDHFLAALEKLRVDCGSPSYAKIAEITARLRELYPSPNREFELPPLTKPTISAVLLGQRDSFPAGDWVAAYVLACLHYGWSIGANDKPDYAVLHEWHRRRSRACLAEGGSSIPGLTGSYDEVGDSEPAGERHIGEQPTGDRRVRVRDVAGSGPLPACTAPAHDEHQSKDQQEDEHKREVTLTATEREHLASYGAVGQTLAERLRSGDANAAYQVAVLLAATASGTSETVRQLLIYATSGDHPAATELLNQPDDRAEIIRHAHSIAATASTPEIVALFTTCAHAHCPTRGTEAAGDQPVADHSQSLN